MTGQLHKSYFFICETNNNTYFTNFNKLQIPNDSCILNKELITQISGIKEYYSNIKVKN